jgi:hypothetical protein
VPLTPEVNVEKVVIRADHSEPITNLIDTPVGIQVPNDERRTRCDEVLVLVQSAPNRADVERSLVSGLDPRCKKIELLIRSKYASGKEELRVVCQDVRLFHAPAIETENE